MKKMALMLLVSILSLPSLADSEKAAETRMSTKQKQPVVSSRVTNPELRAEAGSMSKYSLKASLTYYGSSIEAPFEESYKKADEKSASENKTSLSGSLSAQYRMDSANTINFGSGIKAVTPFHGTERAELNSPYISYSSTDRAGQLQYRTSVSGSYTTSEFYRDLGQVATASYSYGLKYYLGTSPFRLSLEGSVKWFIYGEDVETPLEISDAYIGLYPGLDYRLNRRFTLKTSISTSYKNLKNKGLGTWKPDLVSQRVGLGISVSPVIYVYPYINFFPEDLRADTTTVTMSTTFSVF